jgi:hypothetical protein
LERTHSEKFGMLAAIFAVSSHNDMVLITLILQSKGFVNKYLSQNLVKTKSKLLVCCFVCCLLRLISPDNLRALYHRRRTSALIVVRKLASLAEICCKLLVSDIRLCFYAGARLKMVWPKEPET